MRYEMLTIKIDTDVKKWLQQEAKQQCANMSVVVRQAIKLLMEKKKCK